MNTERTNSNGRDGSTMSTGNDQEGSIAYKILEKRQRMEDPLKQIALKKQKRKLKKLEKINFYS